MRSLRSSIIILVLATGCSPATSLTSTPSPGAQTLDARIDSVFAHFNAATPGCAVGVFRAGDVVFAKGYGMADLEHGVPITPQTVFDIASNSKQFTAFGIQLLARQGKLSLDDDVRKHIPELPDLGSVTTLRHLMNNTSGLRDIGNLAWLSRPGWTIEHPITRAEVMELLARQRSLSFPSGERYIYSNTNWILLGMVVERVDGRRYRDFMEHEVLRPLGMTSTLVRDDPMRIVPGRATNYTPLADSGYRINLAWRYAYDLAGMAFMHSTLADLARWDANFYDERLGGPGMVEAMYTRARLPSGITIAYASGLNVGGYWGLRAVWHGGAGGGSSELIRFPEQRMSVAVLCNQYYTHTPSHEYAKQVAELYLAQEIAAASTAASTPGSPRVTLKESELAPFAGTYVILENGQVEEYVVANGVLAFREGERLWPMVALGEGRFVDDWLRIDFTPDAREAMAFEKATGERLSMIRTDSTGRLWTPTHTELAAYAGAFQSAELNVVWTFDGTGDTLLLLRKGMEDLALQPVVPDRFRSSDGIFVTFVRDDEAVVRKLSVNTARALNMEFARAPDR